MHTVGALFLSAALLLTVGCGSSSNESASLTVDKTGKSNLTELRLALIPSDDSATEAKAFEPMRKNLEKTLGVPVRIIQVTDYSTVIEAMRNKKVEVALFGPLSYVLAHREAKAEAFAAGVDKSGNGLYYSLILVPKDSPIKSLMDLRGKKMALVDPASTSGGLIPREMVLNASGKEPEEFFGKVVYAGGHDAAALAMLNKSVDACAVASIDFGQFVESGKIAKDSYREIARSGALPPSPFAYRGDLDASIKAKIADAFVHAPKMPSQNGATFLAKTDHYVGIKDSDFQGIADLVDKLKLSRDQVLRK